MDLEPDLESSIAALDAIGEALHQALLRARPEMFGARAPVATAAWTTVLCIACAQHRVRNCLSRFRTNVVRHLMAVVLLLVLYVEAALDARVTSTWTSVLGWALIIGFGGCAASIVAMLLKDPKAFILVVIPRIAVAAPALLVEHHHFHTTSARRAPAQDARVGSVDVSHWEIEPVFKGALDSVAALIERAKGAAKKEDASLKILKMIR